VAAGTAGFMAQATFFIRRLESRSEHERSDISCRVRRRRAFSWQRRSGRMCHMMGSRLHPGRRFDRSTGLRPLALISIQARPDPVLRPAGR